MALVNILLTFDRDFDVRVKSYTDPARNRGWVRQTFPFSAGGTRGGVTTEISNNSFDGALRVHSGEVKLSLIPDFSIDITFDDHTSAALAERSVETALSPRDSIFDPRPHLIQYSAGFSALTGLQWNEQGVDVQFDSVKGSMIFLGDTGIPTWTPDKSPSNQIGPDPGSSNIYKNEGDPPNDGKIPQSLGKRPYTLFDADQVLVCVANAEDEDDNIACSHVDLCDAGLIACPSEPGVSSRPPKNSDARRDSGIDISNVTLENWEQSIRHSSKDPELLNEDL